MNSPTWHYILGTVVAALCVFAQGYLLGRVVTRLKYGDGLSLEQLTYLRRALAAWGRKYIDAQDAERREEVLFDTCASIGLNWIEPSSDKG